MALWGQEQKRGAVIVTGASRGIGAAIARLVGAQGVPVVVNFLSAQAEASEVVAQIVAAGGQAIAVQGPEPPTKWPKGCGGCFPRQPPIPPARFWKSAVGAERPPLCL